MTRLIRLAMILTLVLGMAGMHLAAHPALAATTITVSTCDESHLDSAVAQANTDNAGDTITFSCSGTITLTSTLTISGNMTIDGSGQSVILDGGGSVQLMTVNSGVDLSLSHLTLQHGAASQGGAISNQGGTVTIIASTLANNSASSGGGGGGAIVNYNPGTLTITDSTLTGNTATNGFGGVIFNLNGPVTIIASTLAGNSAVGGGAIYNYMASVSFAGSIVANNTPLNCVNNGGSITDAGYNLESGTDCGFTGTGSLQNANPNLGSLANNGGPTETMALQVGSPAIDHIPTGTTVTLNGTMYTLCPSTGTIPDQRGHPRPDDNEAFCDIGAYETTDIPVSTCDQSHLDAAVAQANTDNGGDIIVFRCSGTITLTSTLTISGSMAIDGSGQSVVLDGGNSVQLFSANSGVNLTLSHLTLQHGTGYTGGAITNSGTLTITDSTLTGNSAHTYGGGGGAIFNNGTVTITASTFSGNSAATDGAAIFNNSGTVTITASTFSGNSADGGAGGAIANFGTVTITASTFSGNSAATYGGAIFNNGTGPVTITASTLAGNLAGNEGGAIFNDDTVALAGIIVASNTGGNCLNNGGTITDAGYNLDDDGSCTSGKTGDITGQNPYLGPLENNGGPTETMALPDGSPAADHIPTGTTVTVNGSPVTLCPSSGVIYDQRGAPRPDDGETACDIGAYESGSTPTAVRISDLTLQRSGTHLLLRWRLTSPSGVVGFVVYAGRERLPRQLIPVHRSPWYRYTLPATSSGVYSLGVVLRSGQEERVSLR